MGFIRHLVTILILFTMLLAGGLALLTAIHPDPISILDASGAAAARAPADAAFAWANSLPRTLPYLEYAGIGLLVVGGTCVGHYVCCIVKRATMRERATAAEGARRRSVNILPPFLVTLIGIGLLGYGGKLYGDYRVLMAKEFGARAVFAEAAARLEATRAAGEAAASSSEAETAATASPPSEATENDSASASAFAPTVESFAAARQPVTMLAGITSLGGLIFGWSIGQRRMNFAHAHVGGSLSEVEEAERLARQAETGKGLEHYAADVAGLKFAAREDGYNAQAKRAEIIRKLEARMPEETGRKRRRSAVA